MKHLTKVLIAFCLLGFSETIQAQNSFPATGGIAAGTGGTVCYTIGQVVYTTISGTNGNLIQGVQVNYEISVVTSDNEESEIILEISVYPNPANGFVTLKVENYDTENLSYVLYDMYGIVFQNKKVRGNETQIQLENILPGTYFLKVVDNKMGIKTFRIIKK
jgi:hypothetical protein